MLLPSHERAFQMAFRRNYEASSHGIRLRVVVSFLEHVELGLHCYHVQVLASFSSISCVSGWAIDIRICKDTFADWVGYNKSDMFGKEENQAFIGEIVVKCPIFRPGRFSCLP